nr:Armadillo type fold [Hymenolepis microstoma]
MPQLGCRNPNVRRNSLDVLTVILLTSEITQSGIGLVLEKVLPNLFDQNQTVLKAALECIVSVFTRKYVTEHQIFDYLSSTMPLPIDVKIRSAALLRVQNRIRLKLPPIIRSDGLLIYDSNVPDLEELSRATYEYREENPSESNSNCTEKAKPPQRASPWRTAIRRSRKPTSGYVEHFSAMQEFERVTQSQHLSRTAVSRSKDKKYYSSNSTLEERSRINDPDVKSNSYTLIAERKQQLEKAVKAKSLSLLSHCSDKKSISDKSTSFKPNGLRRCHSAISLEMRDSEGGASFSQIAESIMKIKFSASKRLDSLRSRISQLRNGDDSPCTMRSFKILDSFEKTRAWSKETQAIFPRKSPLRSSMNVESTITTRMSSGYASEEVNPISSANCDKEITSELLQTENRSDIVPQITPSLMPVSAIGKQIRPRLRKSLQTRPNRSRTVHWSNRVPHCVSMDARGALEDLNSTQWEKQFGALQYLGGFFASDTQPDHHEIRGWTSDRVQKLCNGLVSAATCLRSQVSRMAIERIKSAIHLLTPVQLEPAIRSLFFGLIGRVGGDTSTAFLRTAANEAIDELVDRAPPHSLILCLNDACHSPTAKSATGRRCLVRCYAAALPRLLMLNTCPAKGERPSALSRKHQDTFNRMLPHLATFLKDGDFETRNSGKKILRMLLTIQDFEAHLKVALNDYNLKTFTEVLDTISNRRKDPRVNGLFSTLRIPNRTSLLPRRSTNKRNNSQPPTKGRDISPTSPNSELTPSIPKTPLSRPPKLPEVISSRKVIWQDRLCSLLELSAQLRKPDVFDDISTAELVSTVSTMLQDENEMVTSTALKLCLDAGLLDSRKGRCKPPEDKFCPGLLSLLCEKEDTEGFTNVLSLIYKQLNNTDAIISILSRKCLNETRRILGAEALVKPLLHAIQSEPTRNNAYLVHELCDITADLDADSPLIERYLLPAAAHLHRRFSVQGRDPEDEESVAVNTFTKCLINLAGEEARTWLGTTST